MVATARMAERRLAVAQNQAKEATPRAMPKMRALRVGTAWVARGRALVRFITASMSASATQLRALAEPAAMAPPKRVASTSHTEGMPRWARSMAGMVVTR